MQFTSPPGVQYTTNPLTGGISLSAGGVDPLAQQRIPVSQFDKALFFPSPPRQSNALKGFSQNINDAQYIGAITDAELYDTEAGAFSVGQASSKALACHWQKMLWDLNAGESLLVQARVKTVGATTSSNVLFGNSDTTVEGFGVVLYGPTHATTPGRLLFNFKGAGTAGQSIQIQPVTVAGASVTSDVIPTDVYQNITIHVDGATKVLSAWVNGKQGTNSGVQTINAGSTVPTVKRNSGLGYIPADPGWTASAPKAARFQAFRMAVLPAGLAFNNVGYLDWQFNNTPCILLADKDYINE